MTLYKFVVKMYINNCSVLSVFSIFTMTLQKYLEPLKAPENANLLEPCLVEEIFLQVRLTYFLLKLCTESSSVIHILS